MKKYEMYEMSFNEKPPEDSWVDVDLTAEFTIDGKVKKVKGFYAGKGVYKVRFYPEKAGIYQYKISGVIEETSSISCEDNIEGHGIVHSEGTHFRHHDGTGYQPFGTTIYALIHQEEALIEKTMQTLASAPFNKVRFCMFPKHYDYNHNEPEFYVFEKSAGGWDVNRPCFDYWENLESQIKHLANMGIECDIILFHGYDRWGFAQLTREEALVYLEYTMRRLAAFPNIWWSLANEYELLKDYTEKDWICFAEYMNQNDPYGHLLSIHDFIKVWNPSQKEISHLSLQIKDVQPVSDYIQKYGKPVIVDECRYEGNIEYEWGNISAFEMTDRFWKTCMQGGYCTHGETFLSEDDILWWSKGGCLKGESANRIGFLRSVMEELPGPIHYWRNERTLDYARIEEIRDNPALQGINIAWDILSQVSREELEPMLAVSKQYQGHCGKEAFMIYYSRNCTTIGRMQLPEDGRYQVEVIDVWAMTREVVMRDVSGEIQIPLPGREGIAVLVKCERREV